MRLSRVVTILWPHKSMLSYTIQDFLCLRNKSHLNTLKLSVKYNHHSAHLFVCTDRHTDDQRDTFILRHYHVEGYKIQYIHIFYSSTYIHMEYFYNNGLSLNLNAQSKSVADDIIYVFFKLFFKENKAWLFM